MKRAISIVLLSLLPFAAAQAEEPPIRIGVLLPYKGVYAATAESADRGFQVALREFGGKAGGRNIEIVRADTELTPNVAVQKFNKLVRSDKVDIVAGVVSSAVGIVVSELTEKTRTPTVLMFAHADEITGKFCNPYVARTSYSANGFEFGSGVYWAGKGVRTVVTMGPDFAAGHSFLGGFKRGFESAGGRVLQEIWTPFQKTKDWSSALAAAQSSGAKFIYTYYAGSEAVQVVKQYAEFGLKDSLPLIGDQYLYDEALWPALGNAIVGARYAATEFPELENDANRAFVDLYRQSFGTDPDINAYLGYKNGKTIMLTLSKLEGKLPQDRAAFISTLRSVEFEGPGGHVRFNAANSAVLDKIYLVEIVNGEDGKPHRRLVDQFPGAPDLAGCTRTFQ